MGIPLQIGNMQLHISGLASSQHFTRAAQLKIFLGNLKAVIGFTHGFKACTAIARNGWAVEKNTVAALRPSTNATAQLVQLLEPQALGIFDNHQTGVGHIHTYFDHRGGH